MSVCSWSRVARVRADAVAADLGGDGDVLHRRLQVEQLGGVDDPAHLLLLLAARHPAAEHLPLAVGVGVAERHPHEEPVELGLRQRVGALVLDGVRGREHVEGLRQGEGLPLDGDLVLLHRLEQGRLRLRRRAVDLVGEQQAGEDRPLAELEDAAALVVDERPGEVGRQQVGGELRSGEVQPEGLGEGARGEGLARAPGSPP